MSEQMDLSAGRGTAVRKLHAVMAALFDPALSKSAAAVLSCLAEHANRESGLAWPGHGLLAAETGLSKRQVTRAMQDLREARYILVAEESRPARTARYLLSYKGEDRVSALFDWSNRNATVSNGPQRGNAGGDIHVTEGGDERVTIPSEGVVTSPSKSGDTGGAGVVTAMSSEPPHRTPTMKEGEVVGGSIGSGPGGPSLAAPTPDVLDLFWQVYPKGELRHQGERELRTQLASGVSFDDIIDGAQRFAKHCRDKHTEYRYIPSARNWLHDRRWLDVYPTFTPVERVPESKTKRASGKQINAKGKSVSMPSKARAPRAPMDPAEKQRRAEARMREKAWEKVDQGVWRSRLAGIEKLVIRVRDEFSERVPRGRAYQFDSRAFQLAASSYLKSQGQSAADSEVRRMSFTVLGMLVRFINHLQPSLEQIEMFEGDDPMPMRVLEHYRSMVSFK